VSGFVPTQGLDNDEMPMEYDLFATACNKESRNKLQDISQQIQDQGSNGY
jgi:hypothetical protein